MCVYVANTDHVDELAQLELDAHGERVADVEHGAHELVVVAEQVVVEALGVGVGGAPGQRGERGERHEQQQRGRVGRRGAARHLRPRMTSAHRAATARRLPSRCAIILLYYTLLSTTYYYLFRL